MDLCNPRVNDRLRGIILHLKARDILKYFYRIFKEQILFQRIIYVLLRRFFLDLR
jgi:hypothetical protein